MNDSSHNGRQRGNPQCVPAPAAKKLEMRAVLMDLSRLRPHPRQGLFNPPVSPEEDRSLTENLDEHGQREAIHVMPPDNQAGLPDWTVLDGHRRLNGLLAIGMTQGRVVVRHDLRDASAEAVEEVYLSFNRHRRHYDPLAFARSLLRSMEIARGRKPGQLSSEDKALLARRLCSMFGGALRNAQRYVHVASAPPEVERAHRLGQIGLDQAARIALLPKAKQQEVAARLAGADDKAQARAVVDEYLRPANPRVLHRYVTPRIVRFIGVLRRELAPVEGLLERTYAPDLLVHEDTIRHALRFLGQLCELVQKGKAQRPAAEALAELFESEPEAGHGIATGDDGLIIGDTIDENPAQ